MADDHGPNPPDAQGARVVPLDEILASAPGPSLDSGLDLTADEWDAFWKAIHE